MTTKIDPERHFVIESAGHAIALGRVENSSGILRPEPGAGTRLQIDSLHVELADAARDQFYDRQFTIVEADIVYYRLIWEKPNGGRLEMVWRYEQYFYDDWASGFMTTRR